MHKKITNKNNSIILTYRVNEIENSVQIQFTISGSSKQMYFLRKNFLINKIFSVFYIFYFTFKSTKEWKKKEKGKVTTLANNLGENALC